ncbi:MAG: tautomerase family protein [Clostridiales bacterium]|nr:tautomerase family protein [Clostridiales bacterium]MBO4579931.1 tautomerase family protein [Clostridiales bacterium]
MPHVDIKCYPGRTEEQKKLCAEKITQDIVETLGCDPRHVSVAIKEVAKEDWEEKMVNGIIAEDEPYLYKKTSI